MCEDYRRALQDLVAVSFATGDDDRHHWNHLQCVRCWLRKWGLTREPLRAKDPEPGQCCFCGAETASGIFIRVAPGDRSIPYCPDFAGFIYRPRGSD